MTRAERSRELNAMLATHYMKSSEDFKKREEVDPEWAAEVRKLADKIKAPEGPEGDEEEGSLIRF